MKKIIDKYIKQNKKMSNGRPLPMDGQNTRCFTLNLVTLTTFMFYLVNGVRETTIR